MLVLGLHFESQDFIPSVGHKVACLVENHTRKVKDISLIPISGITVFYGCKLNPQAQLVVLGLCYTHTLDQRRFSGKGCPCRGQHVTPGLLGGNPALSHSRSVP